jgi:hypothetical protein
VVALAVDCLGNRGSQSQLRAFILPDQKVRMSKPMCCNGSLKKTDSLTAVASHISSCRGNHPALFLFYPEFFHAYLRRSILLAVGRS